MSYPPAQTLGDHLQLVKTKNEIRVLDLAAGSGIWGIALAEKSPRVRVTAVDWPGMIPTTKRITQKFGVGDRFNYLEGDVLKANFGNGYDIATLGHILHSEGEERSRQLLKKTFSALKPGGIIAVAEWLVNDKRTEPTHSLMFAVQMLVNTEISHQDQDPRGSQKCGAGRSLPKTCSAQRSVCQSAYRCKRVRG